MTEKSTSPELTELVRRQFEAVNRRDFDAVMSFFAPHAVWESTYLEASEGVAAISGVFEDLLAPYEEFEMLIEENRDLGNGVTLTGGVARGRLVGSSGHVQRRYAFVTTWAEGVIERLKMYTDIDEARAAAERLAEERG